MNDQKCPDCDHYEKQGHNFCRICGFNVRHGYVRNAPVPAPYQIREKFCGYCGGVKYACECK